MIFTKTMVDGFIHKHQQMFLVKELRLGQMFYDHFKLHHTQDRELADRIYESDGERFWKLIWEHTDWNQ
jgi:hypothetical protein